MKIEYTMLAPVSHIGETASNGSYFQTVLTADGRVPVITGNSIRGQLRDCIASHLLDTACASKIGGVQVNKEVFHVLFSGGNLNGTMRDDIEKAKQVRAHFPAVSLLGAGLGDMIMPGKLLISTAYPVCQETEWITGITSDQSWHELIDEIEFTRTDDAKNDLLSKYIDSADTAESKSKAAQQMRFSVQYMAAGTVFVQNITALPGVTDLEMGALYAGLLRWFQNPRIGGMSAKGFGIFDADVDVGDIRLDHGEISVSERVSKLVLSYEDFIRDEGDRYFSLLESKGGGKGGKKTDVSN